MPAMRDDEAGQDEGPLRAPLGEALGGERRRPADPTVAAVKITPVSIAS